MRFILFILGWDISTGVKAHNVFMALEASCANIYVFKAFGYFNLTTPNSRVTTIVHRHIIVSFTERHQPIEKEAPVLFSPLTYWLWLLSLPIPRDHSFPMTMTTTTSKPIYLASITTLMTMRMTLLAIYGIN